MTGKINNEARHGRVSGPTKIWHRVSQHALPRRRREARFSSPFCIFLVGDVTEQPTRDLAENETPRPPYLQFVADGCRPTVGMQE